MKKFTLLLIPLLIASTFSSLAETIEDAAIGLKLEAPKGFTKGTDLPPENEYLGVSKAILLAPDVAESKGSVLVHYMSLPPGVSDFASFKDTISSGLGSYFGEHYKEIKKGDTKVGEKEAFFLEYDCMGGDTGPSPTGTVPLRVRWYVVKDTDSKYLGVICVGKRDQWEKLEPEFTKAFKGLKLEKK